MKRRGPRWAERRTVILGGYFFRVSSDKYRFAAYIDAEQALTMRHGIQVVLGMAIALSPGSSVIAGSAREQGRQAALIVIGALTVAHCAVKYEAWTESQAKGYVDMEMSRLSDYQLRTVSRVPYSIHEQAVNRTLANYGGCHNYLLQAGHDDLLPAR